MISLSDALISIEKILHGCLDGGWNVNHVREGMGKAIGAAASGSGTLLLAQIIPGMKKIFHPHFPAVKPHGSRREKGTLPDTSARTVEAQAQLLELAHDAILVRDLNAVITFWNRGAEELYGWSRQDAIGKTTRALLGSVFPKPEEEILSDVYDRGRWEGEITQLTRTGEHIIVASRWAVQYDDRGSPLAILEINRDITDQKQSEGLLRQAHADLERRIEERTAEVVRINRSIRYSEERFRAIFEQAAVGIALVGRDGRWIRVNDRLCEILGYSHEELRARSFQDITYPEDLEADLANMQRLMDGGLQTYTMEKRYIRADGKIVWANLTVSLMQDSLLGEPDYFISVIEDITGRKEAEAELQASESRFRNLFNIIPDMVFVFDVDDRGTPGRILELNDVAASTFGYSKEEMLSLTRLDIQKSEQVPYLIINLQKVLADGFATYEDVLVTRDGREFPSETHAHSYVLRGKRVILSVAREITERKRAEGDLRQSLREKEILLKEVHHRVKNNLQVISSLLKLQSQYTKDPNALDLLRESQDRIKSMALVHEKLYQTKNLAEVNFGEYLKNLATNLLRSHGAEAQNIDLKLNVSDAMMSIDTAIPCGLIVNELVTNAFKHAFVNDRRGEISIDLNANEQGKYSLRVADNGKGFPEEIDFQKTESLGLQLVNTLVEELGGVIEMHRNGGTAFTVSFVEIKYKERA